MAATRDGPSLSVVIPIHNAPENLERCLAGLRDSTVAHELVLVDDCSTDPRTLALAEGCGATLHRLAVNSGPAAARNAGAQLASGEILVFIDSDCVAHPDTLARMQAAFRGDPELSALFGSYDDTPAHPDAVSVYRNLLHHHTHHTGPREASTFWSGCGAIRRELFLRLGGFDAVRFPRPMIEDIELGMRLQAEGARIRLLPEIQVTHLKRWRFVEMIKIDVTCRAIPWTQLLIERPAAGRDLNIEGRQKLCVALVFLALAAGAGLGLGALLFGLHWGLSLLAPLVLLLPVLWINRGLYGLFLRRRGPAFALFGIALHLLYFFYSGLAFLWVQLTVRLQPKRAPAT